MVNVWESLMQNVTASFSEVRSHRHVARTVRWPVGKSVQSVRAHFSWGITSHDVMCQDGKPVVQ